MSSKYPLLIGITGGIGAGKSVVCKVFKALGTPVYDADSRAKKLMEISPSLKANIIGLFGEKAYEETGKLNNKYIAGEVFHTKEKLSRLNGYVHPAVKEDFKNWVEQNKAAEYVLKEAALLIETGSFTDLDKLILITAPKDVKIQRVLARDPHRDKEQVLAIMNKQLDDEVKVKKAQHILVNDNKSMLLPQILSLHQAFKN